MSEERIRTNPPRRGPGRGPGPIEKPADFGKAMSKLIKFLKPYYPVILVSLMFAAAASVLNILAPSKLKDLTNEIMVSQFGIGIDMGAVAKAGITLIAFYGGNALLNYVQSFMMVGVTQGTGKRFRTSISKKINAIPLGYFDGKAYGDTLSRVTNDVDTVAFSLNQSLATLLQSVILLVGVLIAMFVTKWQMALTAILTVPVSAILMVVIIKRSQPLFVAQQRYLGELNGLIEEDFSGQNIIKLFNAGERKRKDFSEVNRKLFSTNRKAQFVSGLMMPLMTFISNLGYVAICVVGAVLFKNDPMNMAGVIVSFFVYVRLFQNPINQLGQAFNQLQSTAAAAERVFEFLEEKEQEDESEKIYVPEKVRGEVEFRDVRFGYDPDKIIINDFSAKIAPGMKVAIVGPTGAGKTTMVNLIMRFYEVNGGDILIDGVSVSEMKRETVRDMFSMVLQDTWLFEGTIRENIVYSKRGVTQEMLDEAVKAANLDYFISTLPNGYETVLDEESNVSGGQKQLITIARAMIQNSPMMILDEATSNVDTRTEELIQEAMDRLTSGRTSFVIAHRLSTIRNADLILVMKDGNIVEQGNHERLIALNGFYASLYNSQFEQID
ncbi:MAG: ABC transporter ATP-binding protein [Clostridia bacterium]|nr:ABC transporter ATP-binding protein [Clostridia bacterium]